jgi:hypothetical protein
MAPKQYVLSGGTKKWRQDDKVMDQDRTSDKDRIWQRKGQRKEGKDSTWEEREQAGEDTDPRIGATQRFLSNNTVGAKDVDMWNFCGYVICGFLWNMQLPQKFNINFSKVPFFVLSKTKINIFNVSPLPSLQYIMSCTLHFLYTVL